MCGSAIDLRERERERRVVGVYLKAVVPNQSSTKCNNSVD
jgi:hypothetical protein